MGYIRNIQKIRREKLASGALIIYLRQKLVIPFRHTLAVFALEIGYLFVRFGIFHTHMNPLPRVTGLTAANNLCEFPGRPIEYLILV